MQNIKSECAFPHASWTNGGSLALSSIFIPVSLVTATSRNTGLAGWGCGEMIQRCYLSVMYVGALKFPFSFFYEISYAVCLRGRAPRLLRGTRKQCFDITTVIGWFDLKDHHSAVKPLVKRRQSRTATATSAADSEIKIGLSRGVDGPLTLLPTHTCGRESLMKAFQVPADKNAWCTNKARRQGSFSAQTKMRSLNNLIFSDGVCEMLHVGSWICRLGSSSHSAYLW